MAGVEIARLCANGRFFSSEIFTAESAHVLGLCVWILKTLGGVRGAVEDRAMAQGDQKEGEFGCFHMICRQFLRDMFPFL